MQALFTLPIDWIQCGAVTWRTPELAPEPVPGLEPDVPVEPEELDVLLKACWGDLRAHRRAYWTPNSFG